MKSLIDKFYKNTSAFEALLLAIPFILWVFCFFNFFNGKLWLQEDAVSYAAQIGFYTDNLSRGIYPLWDPAWLSGAPYDFFLRRIGEVNPILFLIIFLKWLGVPSATAYLVFLGMYYFLAGWALYLITRFLLVDRFYAFTAYILFLFSSWGPEIFYNYIIIIFVPIIWFFYFLLCFSKIPQKGPFSGMCLCVGLVVTTYIPFFFLTILMIFTALYILFYGRQFLEFLKGSFLFFYKNKILTGFCVVFLLTSCIPALVFYKESKNGEFVLPARHSGADVSSAVAVGVQNVASGDIISHGYFDRLFDDHGHIDMGDIYIPYVFFLILLCTVCARANKLIFFLLFNILGLSLITITSAGGVHRFLYEHLIIFKFIRNIYYFFWLAMLPMGILLFVTAFKSLLTAINSSSRKTAWFIFIIVCHLVFILFLLGRQGVLWGAWAAVFISLVYFIIYFRCENRISYPAGFCLFLLAVFIQSVQVYGFLDDKLFQLQRRVAHDREKQAVERSKFSGIGSIKGTILDPDNKNGIWENVSSTEVRLKWDYVISRRVAREASKGDWDKVWPIMQGTVFGYPRKNKSEIYFASRWFSILVNFIDPEVLEEYVNYPFIFYDNVVPYNDSPQFFKIFETSIASNNNIAYVSKFESDPGDWRSDPDAQSRADVEPVVSGKLTMVRSDANTFVLRTHLSQSQFLVINDNYNSDWHAFINGHPARLLRANVSFKGLWVPSGESAVLLRFSSPQRYAFHFALIILFAWTFLYFISRIMKEKRP